MLFDYNLSRSVEKLFIHHMVLESSIPMRQPNTKKPRLVTREVLPAPCSGAGSVLIFPLTHGPVQTKRSKRRARVFNLCARWLRGGAVTAPGTYKEHLPAKNQIDLWNYIAYCNDLQSGISTHTQIQRPFLDPSRANDHARRIAVDTPSPFTAPDSLLHG